MFIICLIPLVSCQNQPEQMSVLDNIEEISVSESEGYGGVNEDFFAVLKDDDVTSAFEEMMYDAKGRKVENRKAPDFDLLIQYEDGSSHLLHLILGEKGEKSSLNYVGDRKSTRLNSSHVSISY